MAGSTVRTERGRARPASGAGRDGLRDGLIDRMLAGVRAAGLKLTPQRMAIVRELAIDESHPTAQELFDRLRATLPTMSFATVYNTLAALSEANLCVAMSLAPGSGRFDPNMGAHHHLVCDGCGAVRDVPIEPGAKPPQRTTRTMMSRAAPGFQLRSVEQIFRGLCAACAGRASLARHPAQPDDRKRTRRSTS
jgi:Fe2+ or Zn2+ uptake regulation protein